MKLKIIAAIAALLVTGSIYAQEKPKPEPKDLAATLEPGTYVWSGAAWTPMTAVKSSGGGTKHVAKVFVPTLTPQIVFTFRDAHAPVQLADAKPLFCIKLMPMPKGVPAYYQPSGRDIVIVRFDEKKDHRELQITSGGSMFTFKTGMTARREPRIATIQSSAEGPGGPPG